MPDQESEHTQSVEGTGQPSELSVLVNEREQRPPPPAGETAPSTVGQPLAPTLLSENSLNSASATSLEEDTDELDGTEISADSGIGSWRSSRTQSVTSSVAAFQYENGRRYHSYREGSYHIPNDENEQDRLDMQHHIYRIALDGKLFLAPLEHDKIQDVLDVGCGTGLWCIDVADEIPNAQVLGFDLSPIQPDLVPPNCKFLVDDANSEWVFPQHFDLIHTRAMTPGIKDWPHFIQQAYNQLKPGGYIELHEVSVPVRCTEASADPIPRFVQWSHDLHSAGLKAGLDFHTPKKLSSMLQAAGYTNITVKWQNWPVGSWAKGAKNKEIGRWFAEDLKEAVRATSAMFTRLCGYSVEEFEVYAATIANEIEEQKKHCWIET